MQAKTPSPFGGGVFALETHFFSLLDLMERPDLFRSELRELYYLGFAANKIGDQLPNIRFVLPLNNGVAGMVASAAAPVEFVEDVFAFRKDLVQLPQTLLFRMRRFKQILHIFHPLFMLIEVDYHFHLKYSSKTRNVKALGAVGRAGSAAFNP